MIDCATNCRTPYPGGAPANVAAALGKLGAKVGFISAFGNDDLAKQMQKLLEGEPSKGDAHTAQNLMGLIPLNKTLLQLVDRCSLADYLKL